MNYKKQPLPEAYAKSFKPADIRGVYPEQINETVAYRTARAFVEESKYKKIIVGYDMRLSTPALKKAFVEGARDSGADVVDIGMVHSPLLYFASGKLKLPGVVITASHSPAEYNGMKLVESEAIPLTEKTGLSTIKKRVLENRFVDAKSKGKVTKKSFRREYRGFVLRDVQKKHFKGMKVVADIGNGMAGIPMDAIDRRIPAKFHLLFKKPDGRFPNRASDPNLRKNQKALIAEIKKKSADFGIGFDGDGDRIAFLDEKGKYVNCASIGALIAERLLAREPKAGIVFTNLTSKIFEDTIKACGGRAYRAKVGHTFLKKKMRATSSVFGAEHSGHFFWRDFYTTDSVMLTLFEVLEAYSEARQEGKTFSQMIKPYAPYQQTEDVVVYVKDKKVVLALIEKKLKKMKPKDLKKFDGYFVDFGDVWGAIKPSVTEFAIKLMFESKKKSDAMKIQKELYTFVQSVADKKK
jgi:phosphomannomutase